MFRSLFRRPRTVRVPADNPYVDVQTVNVTRQSRSLPRAIPVVRFFLMGIATALTLQGLRSLDPLGQHQKRDPFQEQLEKARKTGTIPDKDSQYGKHWEKQHAQSKKDLATSSPSSITAPDTIALTIPIWIRQELPKPILPNDPTFKEFAKLQADSKRLDDVKRKIADSVMASFKAKTQPEQGPGHNHAYSPELKFIGFNGTVTVGLDVVPPLFAPPLLQVPCVWISPKSLDIDLGWRPLPPDTGARVERVFRPLVLFDASFAAARAFWVIASAITRARINETFGGNTKSGPGSGRPQILIPQVPVADPSDKSSTSSKQDVSKSKQPFVSSLPDLTDGKAMRKMHQDVVSAMPYGFAVQGAAKMFKLVKDQKQKQAIPANTKGACQVKGYLRFHGVRGMLMLDLIAWYLPGEDMFLGGIKIEEAYVIPDYNALQKMHDDMKKQGQEEKARRKQIAEQRAISQAEESAKPPAEETKSTSDEEGSK